MCTFIVVVSLSPKRARSGSAPKQCHRAHAMSAPYPRRSASDCTALIAMNDPCQSRSSSRTEVLLAEPSTSCTVAAAKKYSMIAAT
jgi:hypothetical protein